MKEMLREFYSTTMYRLRMAQSIIGMPYWIIVLTFVTFDKIAEWSNIRGFKLLFILIILNSAIVYIIGFVYEKWKIWHTDFRVTNERNPFYWTWLTPSQIAQIRGIYIPLMKSLNKITGDLDEDIERVEHWIRDKNVEYGLEDIGLEEIKKKMKKAMERKT